MATATRRKDNKQSLWEDYIRTSPKDIPLTDKNILEAVREVRYEKVQNLIETKIVTYNNLTQK